MAYTAINVSTSLASGLRVDNAGQAGVEGGAGTGHKFSNDGNVYVYIHNTAANTPAVVFLASGTFRGAALTTANVTVTTVANGEYIIGRFDPAVFNDADGYVRVYYSGNNEDEVKILPFKAS